MTASGSGKLEAILTEVRYEDIDRSQLHKLVRNGGEDGPWIMGVRQELIDALAELSADAAAAAAARWADTDEFKLRPTDPPRQQDIEDLTGRLAAMTGLAEGEQAGRQADVPLAEPLNPSPLRRSLSPAQDRLYVPVSTVFARMWSLIAASMSAREGVPVNPSVRSSAYRVNT